MRDWIIACLDDSMVASISPHSILAYQGCACARMCRSGGFARGWSRVVVRSTINIRHSAGVVREGDSRTAGGVGS